MQNFLITVGLSIVIIKKVAKDSGVGRDFKPVLSRKKRKSVTLEEGIGGKKMPTKVPSGHSWDFETGNTTKSESIDIEKECLVEETSFDYGESKIFADEDHNQMPKGPSVKTKKALGKSLGKKNFSDCDNNDDVLSDIFLELSSSLKNLVTVFVRKSFALNIGLNKVIRKFSQEKLMMVKKLFSKVNGFGEASTPSKFLEIICASFTSESSLAQATEKARVANILVNSDLKKSTSHSDQTVVIKEIPVGTSVEAQKTVVEFKQLNHADLVAAKWSILIRKDAICVARANLDKETWDARDHHRALLYTLPIETNVRYTVVYFNSADLLDAVVGTTPKSDYTLISCAKGKKVSFGNLSCRMLLDADKSRLAMIYSKHSAPVVCPIFFGGLSWTKIANGFSSPPLSGQVVSMNSDFFLEMKLSLMVVSVINNRFATFEYSLTSLAERVDMLAKRLKTLEPMVSQLSSGCQPLMIPLLQNQRVDIVMSKSSGVAAGSGTAVGVVVFNSSVIRKIKNTLKNFAIMIMGLSAKMDNVSLVPAVSFSQ
ncbi:hypothetical protein G9A89_016561 [Geosiphon pyriformis]|nr:hypothetical protein G9A89_016561 [Geosiphon pyriformis]